MEGTNNIMGDVKITELKRYLANVSDNELRGELVDLFKLFPQVKEYFAVKLKPEAETVLMEKYKKIIKNE